MREALIVWGGWSGHEPEEGARIVGDMLEKHGFKVYIENTTEAFADPAIADMSLIVPIVTMAKIEKEEVENLAAAVRGGVGLAGYHGGMCDAFRDCAGYQFMCGGQWVAYPGGIIDYRVDVAAPGDPIMQGLSSFAYRSEQYYMHVGHHAILRRTRAVDRRRRHAGGVEAAAWAGARLLQFARPCRQRIRNTGNAHNPRARLALGCALTGLKVRPGRVPRRGGNGRGSHGGHP